MEAEYSRNLLHVFRHHLLQVDVGMQTPTHSDIK